MNHKQVSMRISAIGFSVVTGILSLLQACTSNEIGNSKDVKTEAIYFDYAISGEEDDANVTCKLQYRMGGPNGTTLVIAKPGKVEIDGEPVGVDSSKFAGAYYEIQKPVTTFAGKHTITFTDVNNEKYQEEFEFRPVKLVTEVPEIVQRGDLVFELEGLDPEEYVRVSLTDTVFTSNGIQRVDTVQNGRLVISRSDLEEVASGPVTLIISREKEQPLKNGTPEGGRLSLIFSLKREFELKN
jgi:hypothetical protein